jgi:hypothetical protein
MNKRSIKIYKNNFDINKIIYHIAQTLDYLPKLCTGDLYKPRNISITYTNELKDELILDYNTQYYSSLSEEKIIELFEDFLYLTPKRLFIFKFNINYNFSNIQLDFINNYCPHLKIYIEENKILENNFECYIPILILNKLVMFELIDNIIQNCKIKFLDNNLHYFLSFLGLCQRFYSSDLNDQEFGTPIFCINKLPDSYSKFLKCLRLCNYRFSMSIDPNINMKPLNLSVLDINFGGSHNFPFFKLNYDIRYLSYIQELAAGN